MENIKNVINEGMEEAVKVVEAVPVKSRTGLKIAGIAAGVLTVGFAGYKGIQAIKAKRQAKKEQEEIENTCEPTEPVED